MIVFPTPPHRACVAAFAIDDACLARARAGEPAALEVLLRACAPHALRWCRRLAGPRVDADDAAQDVLVVVFRRVDRLESAAGLPAWLFAITRRVLSDHRRRAWVTRWLPGAWRDAASGDDPHASAELSQVSRRLQAALERLAPAQREAFVLCDVEGHTDIEAAEIAGVPAGTMKSRLRHARAHVRDALEAHAEAYPRAAPEEA